MMYQYNFGFLQEWANANPTLAKGQLQNALGVKSNNGIKSWLRGEGPMPVISMLRFCNTFGVPLSAFFRDIDAEKDNTIIPLPQINDQLEPDGGYADDPNDRQRGERTILNPINVTPTPSIVPGIELMRDTHPHKEEATNQSDVLDPSSAAVHLHSIIELETTHAKQRERYLNIIIEQQKQIADLTNRIINLTQTPLHKEISYSTNESDYSLENHDIAAEPEP